MYTAGCAIQLTVAPSDLYQQSPTPPSHPVCAAVCGACSSFAVMMWELFTGQEAFGKLLYGQVSWRFFLPAVVSAIAACICHCAVFNEET